MAERTAESRNGGARTAPSEEASPAGAAVKSQASGKPWLPLLITVLTMPALAFAMTKFVLVPQMKHALALPDAPAAAAAAAPAKPGSAEAAKSTDGKFKVTVPLGSKILVNVAGTMGTRYLMTSITLAGTDPEMKAKIEQNKDQLMDLATSTLCTKTIADLEKPGARNVIRNELMTVFNNAMGAPIIKEIYITELAIQ